MRWPRRSCWLATIHIHISQWSSSFGGWQNISSSASCLPPKWFDMHINGISESKSLSRYSKIDKFLWRKCVVRCLSINRAIIINIPCKVDKKLNSNEGFGWWLNVSLVDGGSVVEETIERALWNKLIIILMPDTGQTIKWGWRESFHQFLFTYQLYYYYYRWHRKQHLPKW